MCFSLASKSKFQPRKRKWTNRTEADGGSGRVVAQRGARPRGDQRQHNEVVG